MSRAILQARVVQKIKAPSASPELEGSKLIELKKCLSYFVLEFSLSSLDAVQVGLRGLGPFNWLAKKLINESVEQKTRLVDLNTSSG